MFTNQNHYEYEWFYWEISKNIISTFVVNIRNKYDYIHSDCYYSDCILSEF